MVLSRLAGRWMPLALLAVALGGWMRVPRVESSAASPGVRGVRMHGGTARPDTTRSSMDGIYTAAQATRGRDVFATHCGSCHTASAHASPPFRQKWFGQSVGDLYLYLRREMPKNEPGSLDDEDYVLALAYLLRVNGMPAGARALPSDPVALRRIRLDSVPSHSPTTSPSR